MTAFSNAHRTSSNRHRMDHDARIQAAIDDLKSQTRTNIVATARKYKFVRETLLKRFRGETGSNQDVTSYSRKLLRVVTKTAHRYSGGGSYCVR